MYTEYVAIAPYIETALGGIADKLVSAIRELYGTLLLTEKVVVPPENIVFHKAMDQIWPGIPAKTELRVLPADPPDKPKVGFMVYERRDDDKTPDYDTEELQSTEVADTYRSAHHAGYTQPSSYGSLTLDVLPFLVGRPWDQCALNYLASLRPSCVRVLSENGGLTLDSVAWRVTVLLSSDDYRTIKRIQQEVNVGIVGCKHGHGLRKYLTGANAAPSHSILNIRGLKKMELSHDG